MLLYYINDLYAWNYEIYINVIAICKRRCNILWELSALSESEAFDFTFYEIQDSIYLTLFRAYLQ